MNLLDRELRHHGRQVVEALGVQSPNRLVRRGRSRLLQELVVLQSSALAVRELVLVVRVAGDGRRCLEQLLVVVFTVHRETCGSAAESAHASLLSAWEISS